MVLQEERSEGVFSESLDSMRRVASGPKVTAPLEAIKLGLYLRSQIGQHTESVMSIALILALVVDGFGILPVAGWIITLFIRPVLFILLWGKGAWKVRFGYKFLIFCDFLPGVGALPLSTIGVIYVYSKLKKQSMKAETELRELEEVYGEGV